MSISALFGSPLAVVPPSTTTAAKVAPRIVGDGCLGGGMVIECSSRPKKKATAHHMKTRPRKTQPWDIKRKPTVYPPFPPLPPDWTLASSDAGVEASSGGGGGGGGDASPTVAEASSE